jgi:aldehyde dehydrogenase (NAD+)
MSDLIGHFPLSGKDDVQRAVASALQGFLEWRAVPAPERGEVLRHAGDLLTSGKEEIARAATREMGKVLDETRGDVQEAIDTAYYASSEGRRLFGHTVPSELEDPPGAAVRKRRRVQAGGRRSSLGPPVCRGPA